jgi:hypothetical protein
MKPSSFKMVKNFRAFHVFCSPILKFQPPCTVTYLHGIPKKLFSRFWSLAVAKQGAVRRRYQTPERTFCDHFDISNNSTG